jgi:hypothetical protein
LIPIWIKRGGNPAHLSKAFVGVVFHFAKKQTDIVLGLRLICADVFPAIKNVARGGSHQIIDALQSRGFTGAISPDETHDFSAIQRKRNVAQVEA